ncbi:MAG: hypothetical protein C0504_04700 [Candidatus Solibacter sp.]|nr:hypothetical protein [Candidatus Solibacter sp.]
MKWYRAWLRRHAPASLVRKANSLSHLDDRLFDVEARRAQLARMVVRERFPGLAADGEGEEFQVFSQNGEDGILLNLLWKLAGVSKRFVEIGVEDGLECNTAVLGYVLGWDGVMVEGEALRAAAARKLADRMLMGRANRVEVRRAFVTAENVDDLVGSGPLGVLSIDVDGMDYWLWKAIRGTAADVVVIEYNASMGRERAVTAPYDAEFSAMQAHASGYYHGASLKALERLGRAKGYSLAAVDAAGVNAFFVRDAVRPETVAARTAEEIFRPHRMRLRKHSESEQWEIISRMTYETV